VSWEQAGRSRPGRCACRARRAERLSHRAHRGHGGRRRSPLGALCGLCGISAGGGRPCQRWVPPPIAGIVGGGAPRARAASACGSGWTRAAMDATNAMPRCARLPAVRALVARSAGACLIERLVATNEPGMAEAPGDGPRRCSPMGRAQLDTRRSSATGSFTQCSLGRDVQLVCQIEISCLGAHRFTFGGVAAAIVSPPIAGIDENGVAGSSDVFGGASH
jgi:hypothetical protein